MVKNVWNNPNSLRQFTTILAVTKTEKVSKLTNAIFVFQNIHMRLINKNVLFFCFLFLVTAKR